MKFTYNLLFPIRRKNYISFFLNRRTTLEECQQSISNVVRIETPEELIKMINSEGRIVCVEYTDSRCELSSQLKPQLEIFTDTYQAKMAFAKVDVFKLAKKLAKTNKNIDAVF